MLAMLRVSTQFDIKNLIAYDYELKQIAYKIPVLELEFNRWYKNYERVSAPKLHMVKEEGSSYAYVSVNETETAESIIDNCGDLIRLYTV